jgi:hypothetical protein
MKNQFDISVKDVIDYISSLQTRNFDEICEKYEKITDFLYGFNIANTHLFRSTIVIHGIGNIENGAGMFSPRSQYIKFNINENINKDNINMNYYEYAIEFLSINYATEQIGYFYFD